MKPVFLTPYSVHKFKPEINDGVIVTDQNDNVTLRDLLNRSINGVGLTGQPLVYFDDELYTPDYNSMEFSDVFAHADDLRLRKEQNERDLKRINYEKDRVKREADILAAKRAIEEEAKKADSPSTAN